MFLAVTIQNQIINTEAFAQASLAHAFDRLSVETGSLKFVKFEASGSESLLFFHTYEEKKSGKF